MTFLIQFRMITSRGGSRIFSRGGGADFLKIVENFDDFFFRSTKLIFRALPKHGFVPIWPNFLRRRQNFEKTGQKRRFWALFGNF